MVSSQGRMVLSAAENEVRRHFHGTIGGVRFDFRHPDLSSNEWVCPPLFSGRAPDHPGYAIGSAPLDDDPSGSWPLGSKDDMEAVYLGPEPASRQRRCEILYPGDQVGIVNVEKLRPPGWELAIPPDQEMALVELQVMRVDGVRESLAPRRFYRRGSTLGGLEEWQVSSHLFERLRPMVNEGDEAARAVLELSERAERERHSLHDFLMERVPAEPMHGLLNPQFHAAASLDLLFNLAALYGYRQGRLEADRAMGPLAMETLERDARALAGGEKRGQKLREEVRETYGEPALQLALQMVGAGMTNKSQIIREIRRRWPETGLAVSLLPMTDRAIQNFLDQHEAFAALSAR